MALSDLRAGIYCRLSFNPDGGSLSLDTQEADNRRYATQLGATTVTVFVDDDISAADPDKHRPGFEELVAGILAGDFDVVIAREQARFSRNPVTLRRLIVACLTTGTEIHAATAGRIGIDSPEGHAMAQVIGVFDELYVAKIRALTVRNMAERARLGLPLSGRPGFGFAKDEASDNYVVVEHEAIEIKLAAERVLAGDSLAAIAADWNRRVGGNRRDGQWSPSSVRRVLLAPRTAGLRVHQGRIVGAAAWPAILDEATFTRVGQVLTDPRRRTANSRTARLLTGIIECGGCDQTMNHKFTHGAGKYYCRHCGARSIHGEALEAHIEGLVFEYADSEKLRALLERTAGDEQGTLDVLAELDVVKQRSAHLAAAWAAGDRSDDEWEAARAVLNAREKALRAALDEAASAPLLAPWAGSGEALSEAWAAGELDGTEKRTLVRSAFKWIRIGPAVQGLGRFDSARVTWETV